METMGKESYENLMAQGGPTLTRQTLKRMAHTRLMEDNNNFEMIQRIVRELPFERPFDKKKAAQKKKES